MVGRYHVVFLSFWFVILCAKMVDAFGSGAPPMTSVCEQRQPLHQSDGKIIQPQIDNPPVSIATNVSMAIGDDVIEVIVNSKLKNIKGFLVEAMTETKGLFSGGEFLPSNEAKRVQCSRKQRMVTHTSSSPKRDITLFFRVPNITANYRFSATVLQSYRVYWVNVTSSSVSVTPSNSTKSSSDLSRKWLKSVVQTAKTTNRGAEQLKSNIRSRFSMGFDGVMNKENVMASKEILTSLPYTMAERPLKENHSEQDQSQSMERAIANFLRGNLNYTDTVDTFLQ
ncbi:putative defense protein Hdd11-like [Ostrea edulis]|uniref:putative defense protein Hdd11-like n=1 Tax=Ostrea edulis TaxID=37623 RepID=UPI0024AFA7A0|nr:putative defense protein Hdd11-like [Ostrea edulis]